MSPTHRLPPIVFAALALALLAMTLAWRVPMMLWDHLDLVPLLDAWQRGELRQSGLLRFHGGHLHTAAYVVLLVTTTLSHGQTWLECLASWLLLVAAAVVVRAFVRESFPGDARRDLLPAALAMLLALYPGHLANLQWGWQVAVFLCLFGVVVAIHALTRPRLDWPRTLVALAGATLACFSFATAIAMLPVAALLVALRHDVAPRRRVALTLPWLAACVPVVLAYQGVAHGDPAHAPDVELHYALNFLGAGIARFATDLAPWLAAAGIALAAWLATRQWRDRRCLPWIGLLAFALLAAALTAAGRAAPFGTEQAFVTRYVSFSCLLWLGLAGLIGHASRTPAMRIALAVVALFACANALHMIHKAQEVGTRTQRIATTIRDAWPEVDDKLLGEIYFAQPRVARERLQWLHERGYAPFQRRASPPPLKRAP